MKINDLNHAGICWAIEYIQTYIVYLAKQRKISDEEVNHLLHAWNELHEVLKSQNQQW